VASNPKPEKKSIPHRVQYDHQKSAQETSMETTAERPRLIAEVLAFVQAAQRLPGISRIAPIGSFTINKEVVTFKLEWGWSK
jgi:hypothetical protein